MTESLVRGHRETRVGRMRDREGRGRDNESREIELNSPSEKEKRGREREEKKHVRWSLARGSLDRRNGERERQKVT